MSTSSVRRIKERGGGGGGGSGGGSGGGGGIVKAAAPVLTTAAKSYRSITPVSDRSTNGGGDSFKRSTGKENPRPSSRIRAAAAAKPVIRQMPRIDKALACAAGNSETRLRWSTSSVPRGRSSSPSEFSRDLSDLRKTRVSRVSEVDRNRASERVQEKKSAFRDSRCENGTRAVERVQEKKAAYRDLNVKSNEKREIGIRGLKESKCLIRNVVGLEESSELYKELDSKSGGTKDSSVMVLGDRNGEVDLSTTSKKSSSENSNSISNLDCSKLVLDGTRGSEESKGRCSVRLRSNEAAEKSVNGVNVGAKELGRKSLNRSSGSEISKEKVASEGVSGSAMKKYPSRLHEKLAFLEGKVKRIASDIKRTKEILDMNNPDASKVILTDIHEKISGIEKVMGHVVDGAETKMVVADHGGGDDNQQINIVEKSQKDVGFHTKSLVKGLNTEELEERLFPHHKLLKDRTSLKTSVGGLQSSSQSHDPKLVENASESTSKLEKLLSPIDENPIALEFLASLKEEQSKVTRRGENVGLEYCDVQEMDGAVNSAAQDSSNINNREESIELILTTSETLEEFDDQENRPSMVIEEESEDSCLYQLNEVGHKTTTGGWFVSEGESVLLAHDDGSCSFYDIAHCEEKAEYRPPVGISPNVWRDCWIIRAPGPDGCSGKYVVAASAGNTMDSGFCSWDFYTKDVRAIHIEDGTTNTRTALAPLPNNTVYRRNALSTSMTPENRQWWYKPSGPLIISTASCQRVVKVYDIRDGEHIMKWEVQKPVLAMDYSSPLQWRNRGKLVVAEAENISLWDVNSLNPQPLLSISSSCRKISALHVNNTDAEMGGGVRQRVSSSEAEGNDGVFCTPDSVNVLDFRNPSGVGLKIPKLGVNAQSVFSRGDSIFLGCTNLKSSIKNQSSSQLQQFSLRKQRIVSTYALPESNAHSHYTSITQVWGNSNLVMGVCGLGLFVFDAFDDQLQSCTSYGNMQKVREVIGSDDLYSPSFDYLGSRVLLISRDRPALWRYLS